MSRVCRGLEVYLGWMMIERVSSHATSNIAAALAFVLALLPAQPCMAQAQPAIDESGRQSLADVLERVMPAVVNIAVTSQSPAQTNPLYNDPFFRRFFDLPQTPQQRPRLSAGSGVIVDAEEGYILTNHHVIESAGEIAVTLKDRRRFAAELVGSDEATDIAVLRIEADNLTEIALGDSEALRVGDSVVAIGNPFGLGQTVTSGIVSALGRSGLNVEGYEDFIQTDASINPGNSGGALITTDGRLVGINSAIITPVGANVGIGFAVPIAMASAVMEQLVEHGEVRRGRIGVSIQDLTPDLAEAMGLSLAHGAVIGSVEQGSPAAAAGLQAGDVIVAINGREIFGSTELRNLVGLAPVGSELEVGYLREGIRRSATLRVEAAESSAPSAEPGLADRLQGARFKDAAGGVLVAEVLPGSPAALAGLEPGDVVLAVNRRPVTSAAELAGIVRQAPGTLALDIFRDGARLFLVIR